VLFSSATEAWCGYVSLRPRSKSSSFTLSIPAWAVLHIKLHARCDSTGRHAINAWIFSLAISLP
jgi:hypothetical protein